MEKEKKNRLVYIDILNIIAMLAVVALHVNVIVHSHPENRAWNTSLIIKCLCYWGVPVYFMITGATLMNYRAKYDTKTFFKKRFVKVLIPFLFWAVVMFIFRYEKNAFYTYSTFSDFLNCFFTNQEEPIYYFLFEIMGVYLTMPLLSLLTEEKHRKTLWFICILFFIFNGFLPIVLKMFNITYYSSFSVQIGGYVVYIILGYLLSTEDLSKKAKRILYSASLLSAILLYLLTFYFSKRNGEIYTVVWSYISWTTILWAMSVFSIVKNLKIIKKIESNSKFKKIIASMASCSFGIYLIQMIVIDFCIEYLKFDIYSWQYRTFGIFAIYFICLGIIMVMKKIPLLNKIVP